MTKLKKKGKEGVASEYITRTRALRKLQLSLRDFRRLCILKGIYPRDPPHKNRLGGTATNKTTVYLRKDILFLAHEPLLAKFRALRAFHRRINRYVSRRSWAKVRSLETHMRPTLTLDHLVRERYPSFVDALRDLEDPLSMLALFARLPRTSNRHQAHVSRQCERLLREWEAYVMATNSLRKVFISIKGIYYQASIMGQTVTWVVPHEFATPLPKGVDYDVMLTFLDFYLVLMRFVNYRLCTRLGWSYPPSLSGKDGAQDESEPDKTEVEDASSSTEPAPVEVVRRELLPTITCPLEEIFPDGDRRLLTGARIYLGREVPKHSVAFVLQCMGASLSFPSLGEEEEQKKKSSAPSPFPLLTEDDPRLTHQIVDRPTLNRMFTGREYVQPQWVFDSLNADKLLPMDEYRIGVTLPSHLSPFVQPEEDEMMEDEEGDQEQDEKEEPTTAKADVQSEQKEMEAKTSTSNKTSSGKSNKRKKSKEQQDQKELAISMLSKKRQKLYHRMQRSRQKRAAEKKALKVKREALAAAAAATATATK